MSDKLVQELHDVALWYKKRRDEVVNWDLDRQRQFIFKAFDLLLWVVARLVEEHEALAGRKKRGNGELIIPDRIVNPDGVRTPGT